MGGSKAGSAGAKEEIFFRLLYWMTLLRLSTALSHFRAEKEWLYGPKFSDGVNETSGLITINVRQVNEILATDIAE
jgi:hypothetical protein